MLIIYLIGRVADGLFTVLNYIAGASPSTEAMRELIYRTDTIAQSQFNFHAALLHAQLEKAAD